MAFRSWKRLLLSGRQDTFAKALRSRRGGGPSLRWKCCSHWSAGKSLDPEVRAFLEENTEVTSSGHLTPEIRLRLLTPRCRFWKEKPDLWPYGDPFWAIYWPGGQALSRYILDNPRVVKGRSVLDLGSGCGATAIAAVMSGASQVLANDIDPIAGMAMILNCELNHLNPFPITIKNIINSEACNWDLIVLGDMFYDEQLADGLHHWLGKCIRIQQTEVLIGDPGRHQFLSHRIRSQLHKVIEYSLPEYTRQENNGLTSSIVWSYQPSGDAEQEGQESFSAPSVKEEPSAGLKHRPEVVTAAFLQKNQHFREVLQELSPLAVNYWTSCDEELVTAELNTVHLQLFKY